MIYFSRKSDNFQDFIKFWGFCGNKEMSKICIFSMKWTEQESVWLQFSIIFMKTCDFHENLVILVIFFEFSIEQ